LLGDAHAELAKESGLASIGLPWGSFSRDRIDNKIAYLGDEGVANGVDIRVLNPTLGSGADEWGTGMHYADSDVITLNIFGSDGMSRAATESAPL
jgi:hypothetical protein